MIVINIFQSHPFLPMSFQIFEVLQLYYRFLASGGTTRLHVFKIKSKKHGQNPSVIIKRDDFDAQERLNRLLPTMRNRIAIFREPEDRARKIRVLVLELSTLDPPRVLEIKRVKMYTKWRPLFTVSVRDTTCTRLLEEIMKKIHNKRTAKRNEKKAVGKQKKERKIDPTECKNSKLIIGAESPSLIWKKFTSAYYFTLYHFYFYFFV